MRRIERENQNSAAGSGGSAMYMSRLYIGRAPSFSSLEGFVLDLSIPGGGKGAFLQGLKAKCRSVELKSNAIMNTDQRGMLYQSCMLN